MATPTRETDAERAASVQRRYLIRFEEDTLRQRPLWIRLIVEFLGTFVLVTVAAGSGAINQYAGGGPISRTAAVIAPGAAVMAMIYAWGSLSGLHINPAVTTAFAARGVFPARWVVPYWLAQFAGAICAALFLQGMFTHVAAGGNYPIATPGGEWRSLVMETVLTAILVSVILNTATGGRSIGHNAAIAVGATVALLGLFASPISGASMNPARTLGPDIVGNDYTGWWIYLVGPVIGAAIAVAIINAVRGMPDKDERDAAQGGALPIFGSKKRPEKTNEAPTAPPAVTSRFPAKIAHQISGKMYGFCGVISSEMWRLLPRKTSICLWEGESFVIKKSGRIAPINKHQRGGRRG
jgi:aquaporin Z